MTDVGQVEVTQADRRAFYSIRSIECSNEPFWAQNEGALILSGEMDDLPQIQAFARHRIAAEQSQSAALAAIQAKLDAANADKERLDWLQSEMNDVRWIAETGTAGGGGDGVGIQIISHHMAKPCERIEGENWSENLRAAIDEARTHLKDTTP